MDTFVKLENHAKKRTAVLHQMKKDGQKFVGYLPEGYFPEEFAYAAGLIPVALCKGGSYETVLESLKYIPRFFCTWCRAQIGYKMSGDPWYQLPDLLCNSASDVNAKYIGDMFNYWTDVPVLQFGVPHNKGEDAYEHFVLNLKKVWNKMEEFSGNKISESKLAEAIEKQNKIRTLLKSIGELRKADNPPISGYEYMRLHHNSFLADPDFLIECLGEIYDELKKKTPEKNDKVRLYLTGSTLALGDYRMYELADQVGAEFVCENFEGGMRPYRDNNVVLTGKNPLEDFADAYFMRRREAAWFRPSAHRVNYLIDDIKEYGAKGVVWYQILYREGYDMQSFYFEDIFRKEGIPMTKIETDYDVAEKGAMKTRMETLVEILHGG